MTVIDSFRSAMEARDTAAVVATFAEDVVLHSPAVISSEYAGRERVSRIMGLAGQTLEDIRFTDELHAADHRTHALVLEARVGDQPAQGILYLGTDGDLIASVTLMLRPVRSQQAFVDAMLARGAEPALDYARGTQ
jgi:SnoaL-like domain